MKQVSRQVFFEDILSDDQARRVGATVDSIDALKNSIATLGLLDPLIVEALSGGKYRLCAGRNRYTAIKALRNEGKEQFSEVPCTVLEFDDHELLDENYKNYKISQVIFDSNDKRSQLTKFEQARHYAAQKQQFPHLFKDDAELAKFNNKPVNEVVEALRLLAIDQEVVDEVERLNQEAAGTIPFMCLEEIAEAAALPKRPLPADGQMHVINLLISPDLPDKRALVARDKMHNLVNAVRKEYVPDPRGRKPKQPEQDAEDATLKTPANDADKDGDVTSSGSLFGEQSSSSMGGQDPQPEPSVHTQHVQDEDDEKSQAHPEAGGFAKNGHQQQSDNQNETKQSSNDASTAVRSSNSPTLAIVNISITNAINALHREQPAVSREEYHALAARLEELRALLESAVLTAA